jgi:hypothetical protein
VMYKSTPRASLVRLGEVGEARNLGDELEDWMLWRLVGKVLGTTIYSSVLPQKLPIYLKNTLPKQPYYEQSM